MWASLFLGLGHLLVGASAAKPDDLWSNHFVSICHFSGIPSLRGSTWFNPARSRHYAVAIPPNSNERQYGRDSASWRGSAHRGLTCQHATGEQGVSHAREHLIRKLVQRAFPRYLVVAIIQTVETLGASQCTGVRYAFAKHRFVDLSRARIEWQKSRPSSWLKLWRLDYGSCPAVPEKTSSAVMSMAYPESSHKWKASRGGGSKSALCQCHHEPSWLGLSSSHELRNNSSPASRQ